MNTLAMALHRFDEGARTRFEMRLQAILGNRFSDWHEYILAVVEADGALPEAFWEREEA